MQRRAAIYQRARIPDKFVRTCSILHEDDSDGLLDPTAHQQMVLDAIQAHRFVLVVKYRQAYISTVALMWLLGQVEFGDGLQGVFMAEKRETAEDVFRRAFHAWQRQPEWLRIPAGRAGVKGLEFARLSVGGENYGGGIMKVQTAGSKTPAIGQGISRGVFTEFGYWPNQRRVISHLFPAFIKRPNARIIGESTPGAHNCGYHKLVMANYGKPDAEYHVLFLPWWRDPTFLMGKDGMPIDSRDLVPTQDELKLINQMPGITTGHLLFRRRMLDGFFDGDVRMFENKYPTSVTHGWYTTRNPSFPEEHIRAWIDAGARTDSERDGAWDEPKPGHEYLVAVDPNSYGRAGDPSAHTIIDLTDRIEVGAWSGRVDPNLYGSTVLPAIGRKFNNARIAVEANAAACVSALVQSGYRNVWRSDRNVDHPGWFRTALAKDRAHGAFVKLAREGRWILRSHEGLHQALAYDGDLDKHAKDDDDAQHHFDRVAAYLIASDIVAALPIIKPTPPLMIGGVMTVAGWKASFKANERGKNREE